MTKIIHIAADFATTGGGVVSAIAELSGQLAQIGFEQEIISAGLESIPSPPGVMLRCLPILPFAKVWRYPKGLGNALSNALNGRSVVHLHGVWLAPQYLAAGYSSAKGVPIVLSAHNMLSEWFWRDGLLRQIKKTLYWKYLSGPRFERISALHALSSLERDAIRSYFPGKPIQVIPNGIDAQLIDQHMITASGVPSVERGRYILVLGRLHYCKGIDLFIKAYSKIPPQLRMPVIIAGPPHTKKYYFELKKLADSLHLEDTISFVGAVSGSEKWNLTRNAWALCAPSYSEGMSMVALEAMSCKIPIITTYTAGIGNIPEGGGILVNPDVDELSSALVQALSWSDAERKSRGEAARRLIENYYDWSVVGAQYVDFYNNVH